MFSTNDSDAQFSLTRGFRFKFNLNEKEILFLVSAWSGKERVLCESIELSSITSLKKETSHDFVIDNVAYRITMKTVSIFNGNWQCSLYRNNHILKCFELHYVRRFRDLVCFGFSMALFLHFVPKSLWLVFLPVWIYALLELEIFGNLICKVRYQAETVRSQ